MTPEELPPFIQAFNRLAVSLPSRREEDADPEVQKGRYTTYFTALSDLPLAAVVNSLIELQRRGSGFFPSTQEWYRVADDLAYARLLDAQARQDRRALPSGRDPSAFEKAKAARQTFLAELRAKGTTNGLDWVTFAEAFEQAMPCRDPERRAGGGAWCDTCQDTGWEPGMCADGQRCAAHVAVDPAWGTHTYVRRCGCVAMNPTIRRRVELARHQRGRR